MATFSIRRGDKRTLLLAAVTVSGELFDFKLGGHTGCVDLVEVREAIERLEAAIEKLNKGKEKFLVLSNETYLSEGYPHRAAPVPVPSAWVGHIEDADLDAVLKEWDEVLDVSRDDLIALLHATETQVLKRVRSGS